jgi:soluble lytic murein transglycosylase
MAACTTPIPFLGPTATPTVTLTPTLTPSPTPSPTPTPTPTPLPAARIVLADEALFAGDWERAIAEYQLVLDQGTEEQLRASAYLGLGKARLYSGDAQTAAQEFALVLEQFPNSSLVADAHFLLGETFRALGLWAQSVEGYRNYLALRPGPLDSYTQERIAQALAFAGDATGAAAAYRAAIAAPRVGDVNALRAQLAQHYLAQNDLPSALAEYESIFQTSDQDSWKAQALILSGHALYAAGEAQAAHEKYLAAVNGYPAVPVSREGLVVLVNDGVPVDEGQRGLTNYHAESYEPALAAFDRALAADPQNVTALYYKGRTFVALQRNFEALVAFRKIIANHPNDPLWPNAYFQIALIQDYPEDVQTFRDFARAAPESPDAPEALFRAARLCERNGDFAAAALIWTQLAQEFPQSTQAADAAMQAGIVLYRAREFTSAVQRFELAATLGDAGEQARAWLWVGKVRLEQNNPEGAREAWTTASTLDPGGYYSLRAAQLLRGTEPFTPPASFNAVFDPAQEYAEAEAWLRDNFEQARITDDLSVLGPGLWNEARFVRGAELWRLGLLREAHAEFNSLRLAVEADPVAMWQLALYWHDLGAYDLAIRAARRVLDLAEVTDLTTGPRLLQRLRFPMPFIGLVRNAGAQYQVHPFLMYAKMRIESFFWKYAFSSAAARGLNQIIPATANDIAGKLQIADFTQEDLFRPFISIPMGAYYLDFVNRTTGGDSEAMLAGYYAGPGNAQAWLDLAEGDPDLFVEVIRLPDAKGYVQTTFEYFEMYNTLYGVKTP